MTGTRQSGGLIKVQEIFFGVNDEEFDPLQAIEQNKPVTPEQLSRPYPYKPQIGVPPPRGRAPPPPPLWFQMLQLLEKLFGGGGNSAPPIGPGAPMGDPSCPPGYLCT